jgi:hypothetical protein
MTTTTFAPVTAAQRQAFVELGARKAVAELHPALYAEFRLAWPTLTEGTAPAWLATLGRLPNADSGTYTLGLREARAKGWGDDLAGMNPRQAEILVQVPTAEDRKVVLASAHLQQNLSGGILSGCIYSAVQEYKRIGAQALARKDRLTNARAMKWEVDEDGHRINR